MTTSLSPLSKAALQQLFTEARTHRAWFPKDVSDETLHELYELLKWAPTSANTSPARFVFVKGKPQKEKLIQCLSEGNIEKVKAAPVTAIVAWDEKFFDYTKLASHMDLKKIFGSDPEVSAETAFRNSTLQGAYLILAARALGLDCGPMSGFDRKKVDELFFARTSWKSNFICNIGYGDSSKLFPRAPRLDFDEACKIV